MASFYMITVCFFLGMVFRLLRVFPDNSAQVLNRFIIYVALPALTLKVMPSLQLDRSQMYPALMAWILFFFGWVFFKILNVFFRWSPSTLGTLILTASLGNTSFVGFPLLEALFGSSALATGIVVDQPGTFLVAGTLGVFVATLYSGRDVSLKFLVQKILFFPPFVSLIVALVMPSDFFHPDAKFILERLSQTLIPLSLISVGFQLKLEKKQLLREWKHLSWGLAFKLIIAPAFFVLLYGYLFAWSDEPQRRIVIMEAAMAPMITAGILATEYGLNQELSSLMVGVGIPLSLVTVPLWNWAYSYLL